MSSLSLGHLVKDSFLNYGDLMIVVGLKLRFIQDGWLSESVSTKSPRVTVLAEETKLNHLPFPKLTFQELEKMMGIPIHKIS